jgi:hypothetical protein
MRCLRTLTLAPAFAAGAVSIAAAQSRAAQPLHYWHVWVDGAGTTHQIQHEIKGFSNALARQGLTR